MLGQRLRLLRNERKLTQEALGKVLGVGKTAISQYEKGTRKPDADMLKRMAEFFNVSADFLLGLTDKRVPLLRETGTRYVFPDTISHEDEMLSQLPEEAKQSLKEFKEYIFYKYGRKKSGK